MSLASSAGAAAELEWVKKRLQDIIMASNSAKRDRMLKELIADVNKTIESADSGWL